MSEGLAPRRRSKRLKVVATFGMSARRGAYVVHLLDEYACRVSWIPGKPSETVYVFKFMCKSQRRSEHVKLFRGKKPPRGVQVCKACQDPVGILMGRELQARKRKVR